MGCMQGAGRLDECRPAVVSDFSALLPGGLVRAGQHNSVLALGLPHQVIAQLLVQVDVCLCAQLTLLGLWVPVVEEALQSHHHGSH